jgi:cytochrome c
MTSKTALSSKGLLYKSPSLGLARWLLALAGWASWAHAAAVGDPVAGKAAFAPCAGCHKIGPSARADFGPQLNGVIGRVAGSTPDYTYSAALKNSKIVWNEPLLAAFIKDAGRTVPGTKMQFYSFGYDDQKIANLLAYLKTMPAKN